MKQEIVTVVLAVLIMGLILPGCAQGQVNELEAEIAEQQAQIVEQQAEIAELKSENERLGEENLKLQKEVDKLEERTTAKIEMTFEPDPVPIRGGYWRWRVILKEVKGFGVKLNDITMEEYGGDKLLNSWSDKTWLEAMDRYLPAYGSAHSDRHVPCQESATHVIFVVTGVDDNGHSIVAENRVELSPKKPGSAKIEITFSPNPVPSCENGQQHWRVFLAEVNGIGVEIKNINNCLYKKKLLVEEFNEDSSWLEKVKGSAYLPAHGKIDIGWGLPCKTWRQRTHFVCTVTGIDDNGNEITAEGTLEFVK